VSLQGSASRGLPPAAEVQTVAFTSDSDTSQQVLLELPAAVGKRAVHVQGSHESPDSAAATDSGNLVILSVPITVEQKDDVELLAAARDWVDAKKPAGSPESLMMTLQGVRIYWNYGCFAILATKDRLETVRAALIEASYFEGQLRDIEKALADSWHQLEADANLAAEFSQTTAARKKELSQRVQQTLLLRAKLARMCPYLDCPHLHPPTLASQVSERLRERTRMEYRHEFVSDQIEAFEGVYEMASQRMNDFFHTRAGTNLEWVIIILLLVQILLYGFEILTYTGS
jgi:hypothetical protein